MATARQQLLLLPPLPLPLCFVCNVQQQQQQATMFCSFHWKKRAERGSRLVSRSDCDSACPPSPFLPAPLPCLVAVVIWAWPPRFSAAAAAYQYI